MMRVCHPAVTLLILSAAGCSMTTPFGNIGTPPPAATAGPSYQSGRGSQLFPSSNEFLAKTRDALDDVGVHSIVEHQEAGVTVLEGKTVNNRRAFVAIKPQEAETRVTARFGTLGDEALSRAFLDRMTARVGSIKVATKTEANAAVDDSVIITPKPKPNRAAQQAGTIVDRQLSGGYRDSLSP